MCSSLVILDGELEIWIFGKIKNQFVYPNWFSGKDCCGRILGSHFFALVIYLFGHLAFHLLTAGCSLTARAFALVVLFLLSQQSFGCFGLA